MLAVTLVLGLSLTLSGCAERAVQVRAGTRVMCKYGHQVSSTVRTVEVPADQAGQYTVETKTITCPRHLQLEKLYSEAQAAIRTNDLKTAQKKLEQVVASDKNFLSAQKQLTQISAGQKPTAGSSTSTSTAGSADSNQGGSTTPPKRPNTPKPEGPIASLLVYTPDDISGYRAQPVAADAFAATREYRPVSEGDIAAFVIAVEQHRSAQTAQTWLAKDIKAHYSQSARNVRIAGRDAYLGTDGKRFAVIAWAKGPVGVAIEADTAGHPAAALGELKRIASVVLR